MTFHRIKITSAGTGRDTHVTLDGKEVDNIRSISIDIDAERSPLATVTMTCYLDEIDLEEITRVEHSQREVARLTELEALERAFIAVGEAGVRRVLDLVTALLAQKIAEGRQQPP